MTAVGAALEDREAPGTGNAAAGSARKPMAGRVEANTTTPRGRNRLCGRTVQDTDLLRLSTDCPNRKKHEAFDETRRLAARRFAKEPIRHQHSATKLDYT
eukprot:1143854-Pyramimonas_sp.AAC.1